MDNREYFVIENSVLIKYTGAGGDVEIPEGVASIGICSFMGCTSLISVSIPDSVTKICSSAFEGCTGLSSIAISNSVTSIGWEAFRGCDSLSCVKIPDSVLEIKNNAFDSANVIDLPEDHAHLALSGTALIRKDDKRLVGFLGGISGHYTIPEGIEIIGDDAFWGYNLQSVTIPGSVKEISNRAFRSCGLQSVIISEGVTRIGNEAFSGCENIKSITVPDTVREIGSGAFYCCRGLRKLNMPWHVVGYEGYAFGGCLNLVFDTRIPIDVAIHICGDWRYMLLPDYSAMVVGFQSNLSRFPLELDIPEELDGHPVTHLADGAFQGMYGLSSITLPGELRVIGERSFAYCTCLKEIRLKNYADNEDHGQGYILGVSNALSMVGASAFDGCVSLKRLVLLNREVLDEQDIYFGDTVSIKVRGGIQVKNHALLSGDGHTLIKYPTAVNTQKYVVPYGVTVIAPFAFQFSSVSEVVLPPTVKEIGKCAFADSKLTKVVLPPELEEIKDGMFEGCEYLEWVDIPSRVKYIGVSAFVNCIKLSEFTFPKELRDMGGDVFKNCESLVDIGIPNAQSAMFSSGFNFWGCTHVKRVRVPQHCPTLDLKWLPIYIPPDWRDNWDGGLREIVISGMNTKVINSGVSITQPCFHPDFVLIVHPGSQAEKDAAVLGIPSLRILLS